jgi:hypothetical protein
MAFGAANEIFLVVDTAEKNIATDACKENSRRLEVGPYHGIAGQILRLKGVDGWEPDNRSPGKVESKVVMANIDSAKIPIFVDEKINYINGMEDGRN